MKLSFVLFILFSVTLFELKSVNSSAEKNLEKNGELSNYKGLENTKILEEDKKYSEYEENINEMEDFKEKINTRQKRQLPGITYCFNLCFPIEESADR